MSILGLRSPDPSICGVCARRADERLSFRPTMAGGAPMWICTLCATSGSDLLRMTKSDIDTYESNALFDAQKATTPAQVNAVLQALWDEGVRDLSAMTEDHLANVLDRLHLAMLDTARDTLLAYEASIRRQIKNCEPPF